jgi:hypothetical protein
MAQRNLSPSDVTYVIVHGRVYHAAKAMFIHLGRRDIPDADRRNDRLCRLEGTVLVLDSETGQHLTTAYRNRQHGSRDIKKKSKQALYG